MSFPTNLGSDFTAIVSDIGRQVQWKAVTITTANVSGDESVSYATAVNKTWVVWKKNAKFYFQKEGISEDGDAYAMAPSTDTVNYRDIVIFDGETYEVSARTGSKIRHFGPNNMYQYVVLQKIDGGAQT